MPVTTRSALDHDVIDAVKRHVSKASVIRHCTPRGNGTAIKSNKPKDGIHAYIWRMATFHSAIDPCMPCTADFDLADGIEALTGQRVSSCDFYRSPEAKEMIRWLEAQADMLIVHVGLDPFGAARRWKAAGLF